METHCLIPYIIEVLYSPARKRFRQQVFPRQTRMLVTSRGRSTSFSQHPATTSEYFNVDQVTFDMLPDDILLELFQICLNGAERTHEWHTLIHVCRRWRDIVFASPRVLKPSTSLHDQYTCEGEAGYLASLPHRRDW